jgi:putative tryptophan/tyrosine transport system substrate-binding protein
MQRREFITLLGGAAAGWPLAARAQQPAMPVVGFLSGLASTSSRQELTAFRQGLSEAGFVDGKNVALEYRWAEGDYAQLPALAADLISHHVAVIATAGNVATRAANKVTATIPIVFHTGDDPIAVGLVLSLNKPSGNVTGVSAMAGELPAKRMELLHELVPAATVVGVILNPSNANAKHDEATLKTAAGAIGLQLHILTARDANSLNAAFATVVQKQIGALIINTDASLLSRRDQIVALAARHKIPTMYSYREWASGGGLISYGAIRTDTYRQAGIYVGKILKGEQPKDLPVLQPTKFELVINLKTAKALGLTVPPSLLTRADEVIE